LRARTAAARMAQAGPSAVAARAAPAGPLSRLDTPALECVLSFLSTGEVLRARQCGRVVLEACAREAFWEAAFAREHAGFSRARALSAVADSARCFRLARLPGKRLTWEHVRAGRRPPDRQGAAMAACGPGRALLVGGWTERGIRLDVWIYEEAAAAAGGGEGEGEGGGWRPLGELPTQPTYGHAVTEVALAALAGTGQRCFVVTGGSTRGGYSGVANGVLRLVVDAAAARLQVSRLRKTFELDGAGLQRRAYHSATSVLRGAELLLFGGFDEDGPLAAPELYDTEADRVWRAEQSGTPPEPRFGHSMTLLRSSRDRAILLLAGGSRAPNNMKVRRAHAELSTTFLLHLGVSRDTGLAALRWEELTHGLCREPRAMQRCHSATLVGASTLLLFGGVSIYEDRTGQDLTCVCASRAASRTARLTDPSLPPLRSHNQPLEPTPAGRPRADDQ
jgi:hypothetical protein